MYINRQRLLREALSKITQSFTQEEIYVYTQIIMGSAFCEHSGNSWADIIVGTLRLTL